MQLVNLLAIHAVILAISSSFFVALHKQYGRFGSVLMCSIGFAAGSVLQFVLAWFTPHVLLLSIFGIVIGKDVSQRVRVGGTLIISSVVLFLLTWFGIAERSRIIALQQEFPVVSLKERLAYEEASKPVERVFGADRLPSEAIVSHSPFVESDLSAEIKDSLTQSEKGDHYGYSSRVRMLERLHDERAENFALASGFGVGRMLLPHRIYMTLPEPESVPFEEAAPETPSYREIDGVLGRTEQTDVSSDAELAAATTSTPSSAYLRSTYDFSVSEFLDTAAFGYVPSRQQAAGFEPHAFRNKFRHRSKQTEPTWSVKKLELVSLLKFDEPRVYVSETLPNMKELDQVETRSLDAFEAKSLPHLFRETNVVTEDRPDEIRMLGSLRADTRCLKCHSVERGQLLGAFSYRLAPSR
ncbi:MAG: hypothetical protein HQ518_14930 [Rhodopirellula sp.]|nr:hypothetical protein [Rhodopirellula sp.]